MTDSNTVLLFSFGTLLIVGFAVTIISSVFIQKRRQLNNRLERQRMEFEYNKSILNTRIEVQETTLNMLARELHDNLVQSFSACYSQVVKAERLLPEDESKQILQRASSYLKDTITNLRLVSHNLATVMVEHRDIEEAIQAELTRIEAFSGLKCTLSSNSILELDPEKRLLLFRIVQEALQNIIKHASAKEIIICVNQSESLYQISISDDGKGFDPMNINRPSLGLENIKHRASMLNASLEIKSAPNKGTTLELSLPLISPDNDIRSNSR